MLFHLHSIYLHLTLVLFATILLHYFTKHIYLIQVLKSLSVF